MAVQLRLSCCIWMNHNTLGPMSFEQCHVLWTPNTYQQKDLIPHSSRTDTNHRHRILCTFKALNWLWSLHLNGPSVRQLKLVLNCKKTVILNTPANVPMDGWRRKESTCGNGPLKVQTSNLMKWCGGTLRKPSIIKRFTNLSELRKFHLPSISMNCLAQTRNGASCVHFLVDIHRDLIFFFNDTHNSSLFVQPDFITSINNLSPLCSLLILSWPYSLVPRPSEFMQEQQNCNAYHTN